MGTISCLDAVQRAISAFTRVLDTLWPLRRARTHRRPSCRWTPAQQRTTSCCAASGERNSQRRMGFDTGVRVLATHCARGLLESLRPLQIQRAQGMPDARCTRGLMCNVVRKCAHEHTGQRRASDIPCAMALRLITCSPRRTALLPPSRPEKLLPPGALTPAPRRQDHTSLPYAFMPFAIGTSSVHRNPSHVRGDHDTPLWSGRDGCYIALICISDKAKYF